MKSVINKKVYHVIFLETKPLQLLMVVDESIKVPYDDLLVCMPVLSNDMLIQEIPYQSAKNYSNCWLDKLKTSSYWLS